MMWSALCLGVDVISIRPSSAGPAPCGKSGRWGSCGEWTWLISTRLLVSSGMLMFGGHQDGLVIADIQCLLYVKPDAGLPIHARKTRFMVVDTAVETGKVAGRAAASALSHVFVLHCPSLWFVFSPLASCGAMLIPWCLLLAGAVWVGEAGHHAPPPAPQ